MRGAVGGRNFSDDTICSQVAQPLEGFQCGAQPPQSSAICDRRATAGFISASTTCRRRPIDETRTMRRRGGQPRSREVGMVASRHMYNTSGTRLVCSQGTFPSGRDVALCSKRHSGGNRCAGPRGIRLASLRTRVHSLWLGTLFNQEPIRTMKVSSIADQLGEDGTKLVMESVAHALN